MTFQVQNYFLNLYALPMFLAGGLVFILGLIALYRNNKEPTAISFFVVSLSLSLWLLGVGLTCSSRIEEVASIWVRVVWTGVVFIGSTFYFFVTTLEQRTQQKLKKILLNFSFSLLCLILLYFTDLLIKGTNHYSWGYYAKAGPLVYPFLVVFFAQMITGLHICFHGARRESLPTIRRRQLKTVFYAFLIGLVSSIDYLPVLVNGLPPFGYLWITILFCFIFYAMVRHELWKREIRPEVLEAFKIDHQNLVARKLRAVLGLAFIFNAFFLLTDYFFGGDQFFTFLRMRGLFAGHVVLTYVFSILFKKAALKSASLLFFLLAVAIEIVLAKMCLLTGGFNSLYFFGFIFVPLFTSAFFPWHPGYQISLSLMSQALYLSQLFFVGMNAPFPTFFTYNWFLLSIGILTSISTYMQYSIRLQLKEEEMAKEEYFTSLEQSHASLKRTNEQMIKITSQVAHDIRSPLTSLNAAVKYWKANPPPDADYLTMLDLSAKRFHSIANEVLERPEGKKRTVFSLHKVLDELAGEYSSSHPNIHFEKIYGEALSVAGNRERLQRAFGNIIKNAIEAMENPPNPPLSFDRAQDKSKGGQITLKTFAENNHAVVEFTDTGHGMPPEILAKALKGGFTHGKKEGHGIGMQVVQQVVNEHEGKLEAESTLGKGTLFRMRLPLPDSVVLKTSDQVEEGAGLFELHIKQGEPVVVIDDDPSVQLQWELMLRKEGLEPILYESFEDYEKKSVERPSSHTAIIDYHYDTSELNGFQIIERLRSQGYTQITLCTGEYWKPAIQKQAKEMEVPICPKPIPKVVLKSL